MDPGPLTGTLVVDLPRALAGPHAARMLSKVYAVAVWITWSR
jgi:crotonobetainyl-CoA:carnitine CoA-transferase CaiB-like acyl-CoA transferase